MSLQSLEDLALPLREYVKRAIEFPEPALKLDLASRKNDPVRQFKHLHQMCTIHGESFAVANQIKQVALIDGYLLVSRNLHPLGPYLFARSLLELSAFICDLASRAREIYVKPDKQWLSKGEEFFALIMRARYATSDPKLRKSLEESGVPNHLLKPFNVMHSLAALESSEDGGQFDGVYAKLCDFVHHNLSSQVTSSPGSRQDVMALSQGGGAILMNKPSPVTRYEYPVPSKGEKAVRETLDDVVNSVKVMVKNLNSMPLTPFGEEQIEMMTGSKVGFTKRRPELAN